MINATDIAQQIFNQQDPNAMPVILCRRHVPHPMTYVLHDYTWEGLRRVVRNGKQAWEIDKNYVLTIEINGTCRIPDTQQNRTRLEMLSKPKMTTVFQREFDYATGTFTEKEAQVVEPAMYERIENTMINQQTMDSLAKQVADLIANPNTPQAYHYADEGLPPEKETNFNPLPVVERIGPRTDEEGMQVGEETFGPETATTPSTPAIAPKGPGRPRGGRKPPE